MSFLNKDRVFECFKMHVQSRGTVSSATGSWQNPGGSAGRKVSEKKLAFLHLEGK